MLEPAFLAFAPLWTRRVGPAFIVRAANPGFLLFVLALSAVVRAVQDHGLRDVVERVVPNGSTLLALLGVAVLAAVLANVLNNLPATLLLLPVVATAGVGPLLAVLIGVNVGPNLTYAGSLATLLWRRALPADVVPRTGELCAAWCPDGARGDREWCARPLVGPARSLTSPMRGFRRTIVSTADEPAGRPRRVTLRSCSPRKVRAPQGKVVGNTHPG